MKIKKEEAIQSARQKYTAQYKALVLEHADRDGVSKTAQDIGIAKSMLYSWRAKSRQTGQSVEDQKLQQAEIAGLKRENTHMEVEVAFLKKAAAYFAKMPKSTAWMQEVEQRRSSCREVRDDQNQ
ncbi:MAG: transposase [Methylobacter sp.]